MMSLYGCECGSGGVYRTRDGIEFRIDRDHHAMRSTIMLLSGPVPGLYIALADHTLAGMGGKFDVSDLIREYVTDYVRTHRPEEAKMAAMFYDGITSANNTTAGYPMTMNSGTIETNYGGYPKQKKKKKATVVDWLDGEIDRMRCKIH